MLKDEFGRFGPTMHLLLRYTQALITQMAQTAVCNRHHSVDQQLCRWLLLSLDRLASNELSMTQELIANMLGVRREGVTEAAGKLQDAGLIQLPPRQDHGARSPGPGGALLRVLPGGQDGVRSPAALRRQVALRRLPLRRSPLGSTPMCVSAQTARLRRRTLVLIAARESRALVSSASASALLPRTRARRAAPNPRRASVSSTATHSRQSIACSRRCRQRPRRDARGVRTGRTRVRRRALRTRRPPRPRLFPDRAASFR